MIKVANDADDDVRSGLLRQMAEAGFAVEATEGALRLSVNESFRRLLPEVACAPAVELRGARALADLVLLDEVYDVIAGGRQEGLVLLERYAGTHTTGVTKWKNGHEPAGEMPGKLLKVKKLLGDLGALEGVVKEVFGGEELSKVEAVVDRLLKVFDCNTKVDLNADGTVKESGGEGNKKGKGQKKGGAKKPAFAHPNKAYHDAVQGWPFNSLGL